MKRKNEKGFALVLSLVLLMVMSLLGGSLIVITATDHQSNNSSDEYQQAFYVAETALLEGEKSVVNRMMGPWVNVEEEFVDVPTGMTEGEKEEWDSMVENIQNAAERCQFNLCSRVLVFYYGFYKIDSREGI